MISSARYLARAVELEGMAERASDACVQHEWRSMAASYRKLAALLEAREGDTEIRVAAPNNERQSS
jgi:hypothetical protein